MTFQDFLEFLHAKLAKGVPKGLGVPDELAPLGDYARICSLITEARVFHLEADAEDHRIVCELGEEILKNLGTTLPCPFDNFAIVEEVKEGLWSFAWILRLEKHGRWPELAGLPREHHYLLWVATSDQEGPLGFGSALRFWYEGGEGCSIHVSMQSVERVARGLGKSEEEMIQPLRAIAFGIVLEIGAISHPLNYILERTPSLSPREERRVTQGEPRPARKRPHFIVVDHEALIQLNPRTRTPAGTHRPPTPHARKGHWMRLPERARHLRAQGKTKVWVRDTYVGDLEFSDGPTHYRVILSPSSEVK